MTRKGWITLATIVVVTITVTVDNTGANHFRGGSISWESLGGTKVRFFTKLGWRFDLGCGCPGLTGKKTACKHKEDYWVCQYGCGKPINLATCLYTCTGVNKAEDWEQGEKDFTYTFPNEGPFAVGYSKNAWVKLSPKGKGMGYWNVSTIVDLRKRSDTGDVNSSPKSFSKPIYNVMYDCYTEIQIPAIDPDGDTIRCRWAKGVECVNVCKALPGAVLDQETCTLRFNTTQAETYLPKGLYAVAVMVEDFPERPITMGTAKIKKTPSDPMSSVPLQFLVQTYPKPVGGCAATPRFVPPSPEANDVIMAVEGDKVLVDLYGDNGNDKTIKVSKIEVSGPMTLTQSPLVPDVTRTNTFTTTLSWQTTHQDLGNHIVCGSVYNTLGKDGRQRCFTISVVQKSCNPPPCLNGGKCTTNIGNNTLMNYTCTCRVGFSGWNCETNIDDCTPEPCPCGKRCVDGINTYTCIYDPTTTTMLPFTNKTSNTKNNSMSSCPLEYRGCECVISPRHHEMEPSQQNRHRDVWSFCIAIPLGLLLSILTFYLWNQGRAWCNGKIRKYPRHRPAIQRKTS